MQILSLQQTRQRSPLKNISYICPLLKELKSVLAPFPVSCNILDKNYITPQKKKEFIHVLHFSGTINANRMTVLMALKSVHSLPILWHLSSKLKCGQLIINSLTLNMTYVESSTRTNQEQSLIWSTVAMATKHLPLCMVISNGNRGCQMVFTPAGWLEIHSDGSHNINVTLWGNFVRLVSIVKLILSLNEVKFTHYFPKRSHHRNASLKY